MGVLFQENEGEEAHTHIKNEGSQIFMLGTPLILYVGVHFFALRRGMLLGGNGFARCCMTVRCRLPSAEGLRTVMHMLRSFGPP